MLLKPPVQGLVGEARAIPVGLYGGEPEEERAGADIPIGAAAPGAELPASHEALTLN